MNKIHSSPLAIPQHLEWTAFFWFWIGPCDLKCQPLNGLDCQRGTNRRTKIRNSSALLRRSATRDEDLPTYVELRIIATSSETTVEFPYRRVARLRGARVAEAYASFASFQGRGAFDHDFAKAVGTKTEKVSPSPNKGAPDGKERGDVQSTGLAPNTNRCR